MAGDLKHFVAEQNRSYMRLQFNIEAIAEKYANRGDAEFESVLDISSGKVLKDGSGKFDGLKPFGSTKLASTRRHDEKLTEKLSGNQEHTELNNHTELNSSGNTNISIQSFLTHKDEFYENGEDVAVPADVRDCVASFLEEPTEQEPSDAETLSSHSTDSESDTDLLQEENAAGNWYTEEEFTATSQEDTGSDRDNGGYESADGEPNDNQADRFTKDHLGEGATTHDKLDGTFTLPLETKRHIEKPHGDKPRGDFGHKSKILDSGNQNLTTQRIVKPQNSQRDKYADRITPTKYTTAQSCTRLFSPDKFTETHPSRYTAQSCTSLISPDKLTETHPSRYTVQICTPLLNQDKLTETPPSGYTVQSCTPLLSPDKLTEILPSRYKQNILFQRQQKQGSKIYKNETEKSILKKGCLNDSKSFERFSVNLPGVRNDKNKQGQESVYENVDFHGNVRSYDGVGETMPKVSVQTQTKKSCTRDSFDKHMLTEPKVRYQNVDKSHLDRHGKILPPQSGERQRKVLPSHIRKRMTPQSRVLTESLSSEKYGVTELISPSKYGSERRDGYSSPFVSADQKLQSDEKQKFRNSESYPSELQHVSKQNNVGKAYFFSPKQICRSTGEDNDLQPSYDREAYKVGAQCMSPKGHSAQHDIQCIGKAISSEQQIVNHSRIDKKMSTNFNSSNQYKIYEMGNHGDEETSETNVIRSEDEIFDQSTKLSKSTKQNSTRSYEIHNNFTLFSPSRPDSLTNNELGSPERQQSFTDNVSYIQTPLRHVVSNEEHSGVVRNTASLKKKMKSNSSTHKWKTPTKPCESRVVVMQENHLKPDLIKSPCRCPATVINLQLLSPMRDKYKTNWNKSETLTVENVDLLNQSFNDSFVNVSHNKSSLNDSQINNNKQKITEWLDNLDSTENSLHKMSFSEIDCQGVETALENIEKTVEKNDCKNQRSKKDNVVCETGRESFDENISKPPSKRFKTGNQEPTVNDSHRLSTGVIVKSIPNTKANAVHQRFKGMTNRELKDFLTSDETGISSLIALKTKPKSRNSDDYHHSSSSPSSKSNVRAIGESPKMKSKATTMADKIIHEFSVEQNNFSPGLRQSRDPVRNLSPKSSKRDRNARMTPYGTIIRNDRQISSPQARRHDHQGTQRVEKASRDLSINVLDSFGEFDRLTSPDTNRVKVNSSSECDRIKHKQEVPDKSQSLTNQSKRYIDHRSSDRLERLDQREERQNPITKTNDKCIDTASLFEHQKDCHQREIAKCKLSKQSDKFIDTSSLNEYCEEGGQESCSCDDIQDRHMDLYESFEPGTDTGFGSPNVNFLSVMKSPTSESKSKMPNVPLDLKSPNTKYNTRSPYLPSKQRIPNDYDRIRQDSPCTSMSKLKINTPESRRKHLERSPLANTNAEESKKKSVEMHQVLSGPYWKSPPNYVNTGLETARSYRRYSQGYSDCIRRSDTSICEPGSRLCNDTFTIESAENEKENNRDTVNRLNYQRSKSKKSLFTVGGGGAGHIKTCSNGAESDVTKIGNNFKDDNCFKLPVSPPLHKRQVTYTKSQKLPDEKYELPKTFNNQDKNNLKNIDDVTTGKTNLEPQRYKVSEIKKTASVSKWQASLRDLRQGLSRKENQFANKFDYAQSTPVRPGIRLSLNETFSTIVGSEETEGDNDDEVMLID